MLMARGILSCRHTLGVCPSLAGVGRHCLHLNSREIMDLCRICAGSPGPQGPLAGLVHDKSLLRSSQARFPWRQ
jgi:hypothetical protein